MTLRPIQLKWGAALAGLAAFAGCYVLLAYIVLPEAWRHYEHQKALAGLTMVTRTKNGIPGDPMNIGLVGSQDDVLCAMNTAGWYPADPVTLRSSLQIVGSVVLKRPYSEAPMSGLYFQDRRQDFGFEKPVGNSADRRHHVRFWQVIERGEEGRPVWLGAVTFDRSVGFSHNDARITHHIAPDIDTDRDLLTADLGDAHLTKTLYEVTGIGPTIDGRNGEGDPYYTDGEIKFSVLVDGCTERSPSVAELSNPPFVRFKNAVWNAIAKLFLTGRTAADAAGE